MTVSFWYRKRADFCSFSSIREFETEISKLWSHNGSNQPERTSAFPQERCSYLEKVIAQLSSIYSVSYLFYSVKTWSHLTLTDSCLELVSELGTSVLFAHRLQQSWGKLVGRDEEKLFSIKPSGMSACLYSVCTSLCMSPNCLRCSLSLVLQGFVYLRLHAFPDAVYKSQQLIHWPLPPQKCYHKRVYKVTFTHTHALSVCLCSSLITEQNRNQDQIFYLSTEAMIMHLCPYKSMRTGGSGPRPVFLIFCTRMLHPQLR